MIAAQYTVRQKTNFFFDMNWEKWCCVDAEMTMVEQATEEWI